jgi:hypothetical protein
MAIIVLLLAVGSANARMQDTFGLGFIIGEPTGLSVKYWLDEERAVDGALAWSLSDDDAFQLHGDYLIHDFELLDAREMPVYYGIGARLKFKDDDGNGHDEDDTVFGIRIPMGITYLFDDKPIDLFLEIVPILDLAPDVELDINAAVGARFYF